MIAGRIKGNVNANTITVDLSDFESDKKSFDSTLQEQVEAFVVQSTNKNVIAYAAFLESGD